VLNQFSWKALGKPDKMSLFDFLNNKKLIGSVMCTRSCGNTLDSVLEIFESDIHVNINRQVIELDSLYSTIGMNRLDFTTGYEGLVIKFLQKRPLDNLNIVAIDEEAKYHTVHVVCTKNAWGEQVIKDVNEVLKRASNAEFISAVFFCLRRYI
jgi:uncharacterized protein (TIGR02285 family)